MAPAYNRISYQDALNCYTVTMADGLEPHNVPVDGVDIGKMRHDMNLCLILGWDTPTLMSMFKDMFDSDMASNFATWMTAHYDVPNDDKITDEEAEDLYRRFSQP